MTGLTGWNVMEMAAVSYGWTQPSVSVHIKSSLSASTPTSRQLTGIAVGFFIVINCVSFLQLNHSLRYTHVSCQLKYSFAPLMHVENLLRRTQAVREWASDSAIISKSSDNKLYCYYTLVEAHCHSLCEELQVQSLSHISDGMLGY